MTFVFDSLRKLNGEYYYIWEKTFLQKRKQKGPFFLFICLI